MANLTSQLIVQLLDRVSGPARGVANSLRGISGAVLAANTAPISFSDRLDAAITRNNHAIANARAGVMDAIGAFYVLKTAISAPVEAANALETALAELSAKANLSEDQLRSVGEAAKIVATLTTANGGLLRVSDNVLELAIPPEATAGLGAGNVILDVVRTDLMPPRHLSFYLEIPVVLPVTRGVLS